MTSPSQERVPLHLRRFVVEQSYAAYDAIDQAVWRFVLLQLHSRLQRSAHPAYARGLSQAGITPDRIPRIAQIDACLAELGWGAVCVDGFIPPRAFFELQAHGILPIAAEIRTPEHLAYTPAPDVIHEAAGHAPILLDPEYAAFVRRIGEVGMRAFASARDGELYRAIYELSVVKERVDASALEVAEAEARLAALVEAKGVPSEAARLSRLYWWTVEYGLCGTPEDYRLYGAGLLSSLGESHFCHSPEVQKLPLTAACVDCDYDITRAQPRLFVARELGQLGCVLDEVSAGFAQRRGGDHGLVVARESGELASVALSSGLELAAAVERLWLHAGDVVLAELAGGLGVSGIRDPGALGLEREQSALLVLDRLEEGGFMHERAAADPGLRIGASTSLRFAHGRVLEGVVRRVVDLDGARLLWLDGAQIRDATGVRADEPRSLLIVSGGAVRAVSAGGERLLRTEPPPPACSAPRPRPERGRRAELRALYERAEASYRGGTPVATFRAVTDEVERSHPDDWLLRFNLLETLSRLGLEPELQARLVRSLVTLEHHFAGRYPIASGLRYLGHL